MESDGCWCRQWNGASGAYGTYMRLEWQWTQTNSFLPVTFTSGTHVKFVQTIAPTDVLSQQSVNRLSTVQVNIVECSVSVVVNSNAYESGSIALSAGLTLFVVTVLLLLLHC